MSFAIDGSRNPASIFPASLSLDSRVWDVWDVRESEFTFQVQFQFQFAACTYNSRWYFPRPSYTETLLDGVWFQLLTCTTAGTRSHCHIVATLGSSTQQETLIVGGLMKGSKRLYRCDSAWSSHHAHNLHSSQVLPGNLLGAYWYYRSLLAAS